MSDKSTIICGIDVSRDKLDIYLHPLGKANSFTNDKKGISELMKYLKRHKVSKALCESTGGYEKECAYQINSCIDTHIVDAFAVRSYAKALGYLAKTDNIDAKIIALFGSNEDVNLHSLPDIDLRDLKELLLRRNQLVETLKIQKTQLRQLTDKFLIKELNKLISILEKQIINIEDSIINKIKKDPKLFKKYQQILSVKGIGKISALTLLINLPELGKIDHKSITKLVGLAPINRDSGLLKGKRFIKGGRKNIRNLLYMACLTAVKHNKNIKEIFDRLIANKKPFKVAATAAMRKLLHMLNAVIRDNRSWQESY